MTGSSSRMLALLSLLQVRRDWAGHVLADRLDVTTRTVRRDVDRLRELGYRIDALKGPDGGYRLEAGSELPPLKFDDEQAVAITVALQNAPLAGVDNVEASDRALATIRQLLPSRLRNRVDAMRFSTVAGGEQRVVPEVLETISAAVWDRMILRFDYGDSTEPSSGASRKVEPYEIVARRRHWYLIAWDLDVDDWRIFRADRMSPRTPTGPRFVPRDPPDAGLLPMLEARFKGSSGDNAWPCTGVVDVDLPAREILPWIGDGQLLELSGQMCRITVGSWSWAGLLAWVLRFDAPFRLIGPDELLAEASVQEQRLLAARQGAAVAEERERS